MSRPFRLMRQSPCDVLIDQVEVNSYGEPVRVGTTCIDAILADIQPLSGSRVREMPGVTEKSTHRLFTASKIEAGNYIQQDEIKYLVEYVQNWATHYEAILERCFD